MTTWLRANNILAQMFGGAYAPAAAALNAGKTYNIATSTTAGTPAGSNALTAYNYKDNTQIPGSAPTGVSAVLYDCEDWSQTPSAQYTNPVSSYQAAKASATAIGLPVIATPGTDLAAAIAPGQSPQWQAILNAGLPGKIAATLSAGDIFEIQAQSLQADPTGAYLSYVQGAVAQIQAANPNLVILAGVTTYDTAQAASASLSELNAAAAAVSSLVAGFWVNVPSDPTLGAPNYALASQFISGYSPAAAPVTPTPTPTPTPAPVSGPYTGEYPSPDLFPGQNVFPGQLPALPPIGYRPLTDLGLQMLAEMPPVLRGSYDYQACVHALSREIALLETSIEQVRSQFNPATADVLLGAWETQTRLPVGGLGQTLEQRQAAVLVALRQTLGSGMGSEWEQRVEDLTGSPPVYEEHIPGDPTSPPPNTLRITLPFAPTAAAAAPAPAVTTEIIDGDGDGSTIIDGQGGSTVYDGSATSAATTPTPGVTSGTLAGSAYAQALREIREFTAAHLEIEFQAPDSTGFMLDVSQLDLQDIE